jgi:hypothetical protein
MTQVYGGHDVKVTSTEFNSVERCENALKLEKAVLASTFSDIHGAYTLQCVEK